MSLKIGSLCTGYGGLDMAVEAVLDARTSWVSDIDKGACKVLAHRFPGVPNLGDMTAIDWTQVEPVDVITGGTPCQDLSHAGKRAGMTEGTRSNLWVAMREAIATIRPSLVIWENVGGAYSAAADSEMESREGRLGDRPGRPALRALGRVLGDLASLGYVGGWHGLRAADVGAPHGRLRVFVVAYAAGYPWRLLDGDGGTAADARRLCGREGWPTVAGEAEGGRAFGDVVGRGDEPLTMLPTPQARDWKGYGQADAERHDPNLSAIPLLLPTPRATGGTKGGPNQRGSSGDLMLPSAVAHLLPTPVVTDAKGARNSTASRSNPESQHHSGTTLTDALALLPTPLNSDAGPRGGTTGFGLRDWSREHAETWGQYAEAIVRWEGVTRSVPPATELSARGTPRLSPLFTEWMMGLPAGWITDVPGVTRNEALKLCGNGVVPQQAEAALRYLLPLTARQVVA